MEFHRKNYRQLIGGERYASIVGSVEKSLVQLTGQCQRAVEAALWDCNPVISYSIEDGIGVLMPSNAAGRVIIHLRDYSLEPKQGASTTQSFLERL